MLYWMDIQSIRVQRGKQSRTKVLEIALLSEHGDSYYACNKDCSIREIKRSGIDLSNLPHRPETIDWQNGSPRKRDEARIWKPQDLIALEVLAFLKGYKPNWPSMIYQDKPEWVRKLQRIIDVLFYGGTNFRARYATDVMFSRLWSDSARNISIWTKDWDNKRLAFESLFREPPTPSKPAGDIRLMPAGINYPLHDIKQAAFSLGVPDATLPFFSSVDTHYQLLDNTIKLKLQHQYLEQVKQRRQRDVAAVQFSDLCFDTGFEDVTIPMDVDTE